MARAMRATQGPRPARKAKAVHIPRRGVVKPMTFTPAEDSYWSKLEALGIPRPQKAENGDLFHPVFFDGKWTLQEDGENSRGILPDRFKSWDEYAAAGLFNRPVFLPYAVAQKGRSAAQEARR
jgi:hypothetical protein